MEDFRVKVSWRTSRKRKRLKEVLGPEAVIAIVDLWGYCAAERTDGDLSGLSNAAIAAEAGWDGDPEAFIRELTVPDFELLDGEPLNYRVHDWNDHNPYVAGHTNRSERARKAGKKSGKARRKKSVQSTDSNSSGAVVQPSSTKLNPGSGSRSGSRSVPVSDRSIDIVRELHGTTHEWDGWNRGLGLSDRAQELSAELGGTVTVLEVERAKQEAEEECRRKGDQPNLGFLLSIIARYRRNGGPPETKLEREKRKARQIREENARRRAELEDKYAGK